MPAPRPYSVSLACAAISATPSEQGGCDLLRRREPASDRLADLQQRAKPQEGMILQQQHGRVPIRGVNY
jgi:hypothetical protein